MLVLRTQAGYDAFSWIAMFVQTVLHFSDAGAQFVFGSNFYEHFFAFKVRFLYVFKREFQPNQRPKLSAQYEEGCSVKALMLVLPVFAAQL